MYQLRPYQSEAVFNAITFFKRSSEPALIVLPTGAGKSLVIAELARLAQGRVLVLAHVKELVEQNFKKYQSLNLEAGVYCAGINKKETEQKVLFGSIQSVAKASDKFFENFSLVIIDECHRVSEDENSQYIEVLSKIKSKNQKVKILGTTATPYRLDQGWIYNEHYSGKIVSEEKKFFKRCVFELSLEFLIKEKYLTRPLKIDTPVMNYDFSSLFKAANELGSTKRAYTISEVEEVLKKQQRLTPLIVQNIIQISEQHRRKGVMLFAASVKHAREIMTYLPKEDSEIIIGELPLVDREQIIERFKKQEFKYLVNVSVLTTGFDAPHVDLIAILRPTESLSLYQQIVGRGLRLYPNKSECVVLDYTGLSFDLYNPEIGEKKPHRDSELVKVFCPECNHENIFWGFRNSDGEVIEHFGRKCRGAVEDPVSGHMTACSHRFRFKLCPKCGAQNDVSASECEACGLELVDADTKLKKARYSKDMHILVPDSLEVLSKLDKKGREYLQVRYYDYDAKYLSENYYLGFDLAFKKFSINFLRAHIKRPELTEHFQNISDVLKYQKLFRTPRFIIARKKEKFWEVTEKIFAEELQ